MPQLPTGTVTLLFTDIEGSTRVLGELGDAYAQALAEHRRVLREAFHAHGGVEVDTQGDAFFYAFGRASDAIAAAGEAQSALSREPVSVRIGLHTGEPIVTDEGYVGIDVHRAARIMSAGHGGQVVISRATRDFLDAGVELRDLGEHRLKDLREPEWLFQLGEGDFPPLRSLNNTNLPVEASSLVGREQELVELADLLVRENVRLLTLTGPGGTGKTRLARRLAAESVDEFRNGVFLAQLALVSDPGLVVPTIARTLGVKERPGEELHATVAGHLAEKTLLLVLDNFEHVLEAVPVVDELLAAAPRLKLVVTSRERLNLSGEQEYPVAPLVEDEAAALFRERAVAVRPDFRGNGAVPEICRRLDRLPLAIELAAVWVKVLSPEVLLLRLEQRLPLLTGGARSLPERQRTLRATIEWSYQLLNERERRLFRRLGVFAGGCTLEAAEAACRTDLHTLASLVEKNLVRADGDRYTMLETIREYALERLEESGDAEGIRRKHAEHFLALTKEAEKHVFEAYQSSWLEQLDVDHPNVNAARLFLSRSGDREVALDLVASIWRFLYLGGRTSLGEAWLAEALAETRELTITRVRALQGAGMLAISQNANERGRERIEEALALARRLGDTWGVVAALNQLGGLASGEGDHNGALALHGESLALSRELGDERMLCASTANFGLTALYRGDCDRAVELLEESLGLARSLQSTADVARMLGHLGMANVHQSRLDEASSLFAESLAVAYQGQFKVMMLWGLEGLAAVAAGRGEGERAARLLGASDALAEAVAVPLIEIPFVRPIRERSAAAARDRLGDQSFGAATAAGRSMTLDEAVACALAESAATSHV